MKSKNYNFEIYGIIFVLDKSRIRGNGRQIIVLKSFIFSEALHFEIRLIVFVIRFR